jgi:hypothetical protein
VSEEELEPAPRKGTIAWLQLQNTVEVDGWSVPACHRIPEGATIRRGEDNGRCRVVKVDGKTCGAVRTHVFGICAAHAGGGDHEAGALASQAARARIRSRRLLLGIGSRASANPRQLARLAALERAEELANALVHGPLDDVDLGSLERQRAAVTALEQTFPLQAMTVEVELPAEASGVAAMGWEEMQQLAARLVGQGGAEELEPSQNAGFRAED